MIERAFFNGINLQYARILIRFIIKRAAVIRPGTAKTCFTILEDAIQWAYETFYLLISKLCIVPYLDAGFSWINSGNGLFYGRFWPSSRGSSRRPLGKGIARQHIGNQRSRPEAKGGIRQTLQKFPSSKVGIYQIL